MEKNPGYVFVIIDGEYKGKTAIAYHKKQEQIFKDRNQFAVTITEPDFKVVIKENVLININNLRHAGFVD
jgi:hypothetical protein